LHQGAFAGAVFTEERVNFARLNRQVDVVVGKHAREALYDIFHFQGMFHRALLSEGSNPGLQRKRKLL
jgi:hypothetical protein